MLKNFFMGKVMGYGLFSALAIFATFIFLILPVLAQELTDTPELTLSPSIMASATFTATPSSTAEITQTITPAPELTVVVSSTPTTEVTAEATEAAESTIEAEVTESAESTTEAEATEDLAESTAEAETTEVVAESTIEAEVTEPAAEYTPDAELTEEVAESTIEAELTEVVAESTPDLMLLTLQGSVEYQSRDSVDGIKVEIWTLDLNLISTVYPDELGFFSVDAPADEAFYLVISAPLHRNVEMFVESIDMIPHIVLAGGDLDADKCINNVDMSLLMDNYDREGANDSDINGDGLTDLSDLAILSGNYSETCIRSIFANQALPDSQVTLIPESTEAPEITVVPEITDIPTATEATEAVSG